MRKQVAFDVLTGNVTPENKQDFLNRINGMIAQGWEVLTTSIPAVNSSSVSVAVTLVYYANVPDTVSPEALNEQVYGDADAPKRGRPRKVVEEVAG